MGPAAAAAPIALSVIGTAFSAFMTFQQMRSQAAIAEQQAAIAEENRRRAIYRGQIDAQDADFNAAELLGRLEAEQGASGLDATTGSAKDLQRKAQILGRLDAQRIVQDSQVEGFNFGVEAATQRANAKNLRTGANLTLVAGALDAASTVAGGMDSLKGTSTLATRKSSKNIINFKSAA